jgi:hypothetical protein
MLFLTRGQCAGLCYGPRSLHSRRGGVHPMDISAETVQPHSESGAARGAARQRPRCGGAGGGGRQGGRGQRAKAV